MTEIRVYDDAAALAERAAELVIETAREAAIERGGFTWALAGGSTPEKTYSLLAEPERAAQIDWNRTFVFFGDERFVPLDHPDSNYGMAQRAMLGKVPLLEGNVHPVPTHLPSPEAAADAYADTLGESFVSDEIPRFDLILLGLGDDGHTASLFPGQPALNVVDRWVTSSPPGVLPPPVERITLTFPVLNAARRVAFLVAGEKKAAVVRDILGGSTTPATHPAAGVRPAHGELIWLLDAAAAKLWRGMECA